MQVTEFQQRVYGLTSQIPKGRVSTYGDIAHALGIGSARAVGQALRRNPFAPKVPCHRVVAGDGSVGGFAGTTKGQKIKEKIDLLKGEGVLIEGSHVRNFSKVRISFLES